MMKMTEDNVVNAPTIFYLWCVSLYLTLLAAGFASWFTMMALGALHAQWNSVPAFGFATTYVVVTALALLARCLR